MNLPDFCMNRLITRHELTTFSSIRHGKPALPPWFKSPFNPQFHGYFPGLNQNFYAF